MKKLILIPIVIFIFCTCKKPPEAIPSVPVDIYMHLNDPSNVALNSVGGWVYVQGGIKGIIVYKRSPDEFVAFERNCPYHPSDACSTVKVESSNLTAIDTCCGSKFQIYDGSVIKGPAEISLKRYGLIFDGQVIHIYN